MHFSYEKIKIGEAAGIRILGYEGEAHKLGVPETLEGLPVLSIGKQAFSERNAGLEEIILPAAIREIESFAFSFCGSLKKLSLCDGITSFHDGAIRTCFNLRDIELKITKPDFTLARRLLGDSDRRLRVMFLYPDGPFRLVFPDYYSNSIEDTKSQAFHIRIDGCGFSYRECVCTGGLRFREYDSLFGRAVSGEDPVTPLEISACRLMYPRALTETAAEVYRDYIREHMDQALKLAFLPENTGWMDMFLAEGLLSESDVDPALKLASKHGLVQLAGELMDYRRKKFRSRGLTLSLEEDW